MKDKNSSRLELLRRDLFEAIKECLAIDGHCKSYEGTFEVTECWPNYFEDRDGEQGITYVIELHCYVIGPNRHYRWKADTKSAVIDKAEKDIRSWIDEHDCWIEENGYEM